MQGWLNGYYQANWRKRRNADHNREFVLSIENQLTGAVESVLAVSRPSSHLTGNKWRKVASQLCDRILSRSFMGGLVEEEIKRWWQKYYRKEVFLPWKVLCSMDLAGGGEFKTCRRFCARSPWKFQMGRIQRASLGILRNDKSKPKQHK